MNVDDAKTIAELENICFSSPWTESGIIEMLNTTNSYFYVAELDGAVVGYSEMFVVVDEGNVCNIAVNPNYRKQGIGKVLVDALIESGKNINLAFISLEVRSSNKNAINLYEKCGFELMGVRKNYYDHPKEDGLVYNYYYRKN